MSYFNYLTLKLESMNEVMVFGHSLLFAYLRNERVEVNELDFNSNILDRQNAFSVGHFMSRYITRWTAQNLSCPFSDPLLERLIHTQVPVEFSSYLDVSGWLDDRILFSLQR